MLKIDELYILRFSLRRAGKSSNIKSLLLAFCKLTIYCGSLNPVSERLEWLGFSPRTIIASMILSQLPLPPTFAVDISWEEKERKRKKKKEKEKENR